MRSLYEKLKYHGNALAFILGFIWDNIMLKRIDHGFANIMLGTYLFLSFACILELNIHEARLSRGHSGRRYALWLTPILQFCLGSLFSAYIIFYTRSASLSVNWPFLVFLVFLVLANEFLHKHYSRPPFQLSLLFIVLFSYSIFSLPVLLGSMGPEVFLLSGLISLACIAIAAFLLNRIAPDRSSPSRRWFFVSIIFMYSLFNFAYFTDLIPPIPLALKEIGVYHSVLHQDDGTYLLTFEPARWYQFFADTSDTFTRENSKPVYVFISVFAPTKLTVPLFYRWQYFDEGKQQWLSTDVVQFPITGGREDGYRGYSSKQSVTEGRWRVDVETLPDQLIGRVEFQVVGTTTPLTHLVTETL